MALVALSVIEQRYRAVMAVLDGASPTEVAAEIGVSRQSVHAWVARYLLDGVAGLADRSIGRSLARIRLRMRCGSKWPSCGGSIRGGGRSGSGWSC